MRNRISDDKTVEESTILHCRLSTVFTGCHHDIAPRRSLRTEIEIEAQLRTSSRFMVYPGTKKLGYFFKGLPSDGKALERVSYQGLGTPLFTGPS
jgi:hypothetical protein